MFDGLKKFLLRGNLVELAVAVVIGAQFSGLVNQFVKSFVSPLLALIGGNPDLSRNTFTINKTVFPYGDFLTVLIAFVVAAIVVYFVLVMPVARVVAFIDRNKEATERECPHCISSIPIRARVCAHCAHEVPAVK